MAEKNRAGDCVDVGFFLARTLLQISLLRCIAEPHCGSRCLVLLSCHEITPNHHQSPLSIPFRNIFRISLLSQIMRAMQASPTIVPIKVIQSIKLLSLLVETRYCSRLRYPTNANLRPADAQIAQCEARRLAS